MSKTTEISLAVLLSGQHMWNSLPATIRQIISYGQFRQRLKTLLRPRNLNAL